MKYLAIHRHRGEYSARMMCRILKVSPSGYYAWIDRPKSLRSQRHSAVMKKIKFFHESSRQTYGAPRIHTDLVESGEVLGKNTVALLMQRAGIVPKTICKFRVTTDSRKTKPAQNVLDRRFAVDVPNERWVSGCDVYPDP